VLCVISMGNIHNVIIGSESRAVLCFEGVIKPFWLRKIVINPSFPRYIHRNPIEAGMVDQLETYPWKNYLNYVSKLLATVWLYRQETYDNYR